MKVCKVLIGPIAGNEGIVYDEGDEIILEDATAKQFEGWTYVKILGDAEDGSAVAGKAAAEPTPTEPVAQSPLLGGDLSDKPEIEDEEPDTEEKPTRKRRTIATSEGAAT